MHASFLKVHQKVLTNNLMKKEKLKMLRNLSPYFSFSPILRRDWRPKRLRTDSRNLIKRVADGWKKSGSITASNFGEKRSWYKSGSITASDFGEKRSWYNHQFP